MINFNELSKCTSDDFYKVYSESIFDCKEEIKFVKREKISRYGAEYVLPSEYTYEYNKINQDRMRRLVTVKVNNDKVFIVLKRVQMFQSIYNRIEGIPISYLKNQNTELKVLKEISENKLAQKIGVNEIEETLINTGYRDGVLIVDNMYTSTDKNIQDNDDLKGLLKIIHHIRKKYNLTIILIAHSNKGVNEQKDLHLDQLQGGKVMSSMVSNITQIHNSTASVDLRVMKITKAGRSGKNELYNVPFKLHWSDDDYVFTKGVIISNIAVHFTNVKKRWEVELIQELADTFDFRASEGFV